MRIVSENSEEELTRKQHAAIVEARLRTLTANLMRMARGGGDPYRLIEHLADLGTSLRSYQAATGQIPRAEDLQTAILISDREILSQLSGEAWEWASGIDQMVDGALRIAASRLLSQRTQERNGESVLLDGLRRIEVIRAENSRQAKAALKAERSRRKIVKRLK